MTHRTAPRMALFALLPGLFAAPATAVPISADLDLSGSILYDNINSSSVTGPGTQTANLTLISGGVSTSAAVDASLGITGSNPLTGDFTQIGDGVGMVLNVGGNSNGEVVETTNHGGNYTLNLANNSISDTYRVTLNIDFSNRVDGNGADAFASGEMLLDEAPIDLDELFFTDLTSDTVFGDSFNGTNLATLGELQLSMGQVALTFDLLPSSLLVLNGLQDLEGGAFAAGSDYTGLLDVFVSVAAVSNLTSPPSPPALSSPGVLALMALPLLALGRRPRA